MMFLAVFMNLHFVRLLAIFKEVKKLTEKFVSQFSFILKILGILYK